MTAVHVMHCSMQFSDSTAQKKSDAKKIFDRAKTRKVSWLTGTEAGLGKSTDLRAALKAEALAHGYNFTVHSDVWIAVDKELVVRGSWSTDWIATLPSSSGSQKFSERGLLWVQFTNKELGTISVGCSHYMTHGQKPGDEYYAANTKAARTIGKWAKEHGAGSKICFYGGDQNIQDRESDTFRGQPMTSLADELKAWQNTGHGSIDVIASYDQDGRVKGKYWRVLDDSEFKLNTDHWLCEGGYEVRPVK
jgi:hypothetical protein